MLTLVSEDGERHGDRAESDGSAGVLRSRVGVTEEGPVHPCILAHPHGRSSLVLSFITCSFHR